MATLLRVNSFRYYHSTMRNCLRSRFSTSISGNRLSASEILKREVENEMLADGYRWVVGDTFVDEKKLKFHYIALVGNSITSDCVLISLEVN